MKLVKRLFCICLVFALLLSVVPMSGSAAGRMPGDANGDQKINYKDALLILRMSIGLEPWDSSLLASCDTNGDGKLNYKDALTVLRVSIGLEEMPPMGPSDEPSEDSFTYTDRLYYLPGSWNPHTYETSEQESSLNLLTTGLYGFFFNDEQNYTAGVRPFEGYVIAPEMAAELPVDITTTVKASRPEFGIPEDAAEGYAYKIALNPNAKWDDGTPITAKDYVESMKRLLDSKLQNYRAADYYAGTLSIAGAEDYANAGADILIDNYSYETNSCTYPLNTLVKGEDGQYHTPDGAEVFIAVYLPINWLGVALGDYVDAYGDAYFGMERWNELTSLCDERGVVPCTEETLAMLASVTTNTGWGESEYELPNYLVYAKTFPPFDFENVGLYASGEYELTLVLSQELTGFHLLYPLCYNWLVKTDLYDACLLEEGGSIYNTSVDTTASYGPYKLDSYLAGDRMCFVKNKNWYGYTDGKHIYQDPTDGKTYPMYQTTRIEYLAVPDDAQARDLFLRGGLMQHDLMIDDFETYRDSEYCYFTPGTAVYSMILNGHIAAVEEREASPDFDQSQYDLETLTLTSFHRAMGLSIDRSLYVKTLSPTEAPAFGLLSSACIADPMNGISYRSTDLAKQVLCDVYAVDTSKYDSLDEAVASITGYNPEAAAEFFRQAFHEGLEKGYITDTDQDGLCDQIIEITYASSSVTDRVLKQLAHINEQIAKSTDGTPFADKIHIVPSEGLGNDWSIAIQQGRADMILAGWSSSAMNPYGLMENYTTPGFQYDAAWFDASTVELTLNLGGKDITMSLQDWARALNGTAVTIDGMDYNFGEGIGDPQDRLIILAGIEKAILLQYNSIPMLVSGSSTLLSKKAFYLPENCNSIIGWGGLAYLRYRYNDAQWQAYVDENGGYLEY